MDLNTSFSFDSFIVGESNEAAATAAHTVAEAPGLVYNPLFIHGPSGQGKTHLLMALAQEARQRESSLTVRYMTVAEFAEASRTAAAAGQHERFRRRMRELDMLLLDDIQRLADHPDVHDELCRLQDDLWHAGRQLVLAGDRPPAELLDLDDRLIGRFGSGLVIDIGPPDAATRLAVLRGCSETLGVSFADGVLEAVAQQPVRSVRDLLGGLARLVALDAGGVTPATPGQAQTVFDGEDAEWPDERAPEDVGAEVADTGEFAEFLAGVRVRVVDAARTWRAHSPERRADASQDRVRSREKTIWTWPVADGRLIEELY